MEITFNGVGSAIDSKYPNVSLLVRDTCTLLLDCGYSAVIPIINNMKDANEIDAIYISHAHADHYFGVPILLLKFWELKRTKPLTIITQYQVRENIVQLLDLGYKGFKDKFEYDLEFIEVTKMDELMYEGLSLRFAPTVHSSPNLAIRIEAGEKTFCYSGDGRFTEETIALYSGADCVVHEAFTVEEPFDGHGTIKDCIEMAHNAGVQTLALVHLEHTVREKEMDAITKAIENAPLDTRLPEPNEVITL